VGINDACHFYSEHLIAKVRALRLYPYSMVTGNTPDGRGPFGLCLRMKVRWSGALCCLAIYKGMSGKINFCYFILSRFCICSFVTAA
jgi:hypothetical protein